jgi:hypothetical protein
MPVVASRGDTFVTTDAFKVSERDKNVSDNSSSRDR